VRKYVAQAMLRCMLLEARLGLDPASSAARPAHMPPLAGAL